MDEFQTTDPLERMERRRARDREIGSLNSVDGGATIGGIQSARRGRRLLSADEEDRLALRLVLNALDGEVSVGVVSIGALERAVATVKKHLGEQE